VGGRIEPSDKAKWQDYLKAHGVDAVVMQARAKVKFMRGKPRMVIIDHGGPWDGFYAYSKEDEVVLKWEPGAAGTTA
jgi:hypothetical protein